ncbi:transglutaminase domain-containing protein [uncultured Methanobrevibacter sp.]|uniref:transglutaminase domain-containing protein n=1 Tax=uncultured Methanobrevibacter sp. TaxID=253161 RepID=UPI0025E8C4D7|nr:transglutaminase domain-containing protein [uncultured Methanobrevibacter sp.]
MNKQIILTLFIVLAVVFSAGTIYASDVNVTDSDITALSENSEIVSAESSDLQVMESDNENSPSEDLLNSVDSSTLSTNTENRDILSSNSSVIEISNTVTAQNVTKYYKGSEKYVATFLDINGTPLVNTDVVISLNGKDKTYTTDSSGSVSLNFDLNPGSYKVVATNPKTGYSLTTNFVVLSTIEAENLRKVYTDDKKFSAVFYKSNGKVLANKKIKFKLNGKTYKVKTNAKGVASLSLKNLKKGKYSIVSYNKDGLTKTNKIKVVKSSTTSLKTLQYTFLKSDSKKVKARVFDKYGDSLSKGFVVTVKINGKSYSAKTNSKGIIKVKLPSLKAGVYTAKYSFAKSGVYKASSAENTVTIIPSSTPTFTVKSTTRFGHGAGTPFKLALTSGSVPLAGKTVKLSLNGNTYTETTNSKGIVSLPINLDIGDYTISYTNKAESKITSISGSTPINVFERSVSSINWHSSTSLYQGTRTCQLLLLDSNSYAISGGVVELTVNSQKYSAVTDNDGYAVFKANFGVGNYSVSYSFAGDNDNAPTTGTTALTVLKNTAIPLKDVISGASSLKSYYQSNDKLPETVTAGGFTFTVPEFLFLMSQAICQIGNSDYGDVPYISGVGDPSSPTGDTITNSQLKKDGYLSLAKKIANYINEHGIAPNYASSDVGKISYEELADAFARVVAYYGSYAALPNYVTINYPPGGSSGSQTGSGLNEKNTITDLKPYLVATTNCQVGNAAIKKVVDSLVKDLTSDAAKARAIFNYVRDSVSYSFYYNTKYGATGTLSYKTGNCVDQAHLAIAMFRTAGLAARYVHGTCRFSSGSTYGHVWAQVLIDGTWTVADATSSRNSLGHVANWNTASYSLKGKYASISF